MHTGNLPNRLAKDTLKKAILTVLKGLENDQNLFRKLILSYPSRLEAVRKANGGYTKY